MRSEVLHDRSQGPCGTVFGQEKGGLEKAQSKGVVPTHETIPSS